jgi:S-adenosylmethionine synthetase
MNEEEILKRAKEIRHQRETKKLEQDIKSRINFARSGYGPNEVYELLMKFAKDHNINGLA